MPVRFCPVCGEQLKRKRGRFLLSGALCRACARAATRARLGTAALLIILAASIFVAGRVTAPRQTHYVIGAPVDSADSGGQQSQAAISHSGDADSKQPGAMAERVCGAPTRRGRPCRRKVKGEGHCWQHRDKPPAGATANGK